MPDQATCIYRSRRFAKERATTEADPRRLPLPPSLNLLCDPQQVRVAGVALAAFDTSKAPDAKVDEAFDGAIALPRRVEADIGTGSLKQLSQRVARRIYPPVPDATRFVGGLNAPVPKDAEVAREILEEAQELFNIPLDRAEAAERRATTLQGAVALAATFSLAAGSLLADADKVHSQVWRVVFAVVLALVVLAFVVAGVAGLQATSRINRWRYPDEERGFAERAGRTIAAAQMARASELLVTYGQNQALAKWKIERTTVAARWFRAALALLVLLALLFFCYVAPWWFWVPVLLLAVLIVFVVMLRFGRVSD